jgi:hypothetical protein
VFVGVYWCLLVSIGVCWCLLVFVVLRADFGLCCHERSNKNARSDAMTAMTVQTAVHLCSEGCMNTAMTVQTAVHLCSEGCMNTAMTVQTAVHLCSEGCILISAPAEL